jgi:hypothetical protein
MAITTDILRTYRAPRAMMRRLTADGRQEGRALAILMGAALLVFVSQWPGLARAAYFDPSVPLVARLLGALWGAVFLMPPLLYALAAVSHLLARALGGQGSHFAARMALFWAMLAISPLMLLQGLVGGMIGPGPGFTALGLIILVAFLTIWAKMLIEAERPAPEQPAPGHPAPDQRD